MSQKRYDFMEATLQHYRDVGIEIDNVPVISTPAGGWMEVDGRKVLNFCTNDYLGLANHPVTKAAAVEAVEKWGVGAGAVRFLAGNKDLHLEMERALAEFKGTEAAMYTQTGFVANLCTTIAMLGSEDIAFSDSLNHASIIDGIKQSGCKVAVYMHNDMDDLRAKIEEKLEGHRRGVILTDGVFSMDGDIANLPAIADIADEYGLYTVVDDSHGEGVLGKGRGAVSHFGLSGRIDVEVGTLSKAFGVIGGLVAGKKVVVDYIYGMGRAQLYSTGPTPADTAACLAGIKLLSESSELVDRLWSNTEYIKSGMAELGFNMGGSETPIVPVILGESEVTKKFRDRLFEEGIFTTSIVYPIVPKGAARVRLMNTASHTREDLDLALSIFEKLGRELNII